ncbi:MAG: protein phosphatase 2C domain-containing protein [Anaerolineae bacterium]|nr:protein phosphatase 2C domain-containing protein [Anaerolineae bacterium]
MKCPQCDQENRDVARFCQYCGALLHEVEVLDENVDELPIEAEIASESANVDEIEPETVIQFIADWDAATADVDVQEGELVSEIPEIKVIEDVEEKLDAESVHDVEVVDGELDDELLVPEGEAAQAELDQSDESPVEVEAMAESEASLSDVESVEQETIELVEELEDIPEDESDSRVDDLFWREPVEEVAILQPGTVVNGRYQVSEVLSFERDEVLYHVRDLQRCLRCGYDQNNPDQAFCESCGAVLDQKPLVRMLSRPVERKDAPVDAAVESKFVEGDCAYWIWQETKKKTGPLSEPSGRMRFIVGQKSDVGRQRDLDEDAMFTFSMESTYESAPAQIGLFVVADGIGGHEGGEVASRLAIQTMVGELLQKVFSDELIGYVLSPQEVQNAMIAAVQEANEEVYLERQKRNTDMGTTMTAVILKDWTAYVAHVGDCRGFRWGENGLEQLTTDHSVVASMVAAGAAEPDDIYTHPQRSVIYRSIGDRPSVDVDVASYEFCPGDRLVICCDGLWEMIRNEGIEEVLMRQSDPQLACKEMVDLANLAGGMDNISVIVVQL